MTQTTIPEFSPEDEPILRNWIEALREKKVANPNCLADDLKDWCAKTGKRPGYRSMSRNSINRFLKGAKRPFSFAPMRTMWDYLRTKPDYARHFPGKGVAQDVTSAAIFPDRLLALALSNFFRERNDIKHRYTVERLRTVLAGKYVMYRQDFEPAIWDMEPRQFIRASAVEITEKDGFLSISEVQDFKNTQHRAAHLQRNTGVLFPYGDYVIGIMGEDKIVSFKTLVIKDILSGPEPDAVPTEYFRGKLLVASVRGSFPSARIFCKRSHGSDQHGLYPYEEIDRDVLAYITSPTFDKKYEAVF